MTPRQLTRLAIALGLLVLVWAAVGLGRRATRDAAPRLSLGNIEAKAIDAVTIAGKTDTVHLTRVADSVWRVNGEPAAFNTVDELLRALSDTGFSGELVAENATSHERMGVDSAGGKRMRAFAGAKTVADLVVGHGGQIFGTGYLRRAGEDAVYYVRSPLIQLASRGFDEWRERRMVAIPADSVATVEVQRAGRRYTLQRKDGRWTVGSAQADSSEVADLLNELKEVYAVAFPTRDEADSLRFDRPDRRLRVVSPGGRTLVAFSFDSMPSGAWVRNDSTGAIFRLDHWTVNRLTPEEKELR